MEQEREYVFKVLVIGEMDTGKTAIVKRYVHKYFIQHYRATIGVDFALKVVKYDDDTVIRLQLWDLAGQEQVCNMTRIYYRDAVGCLIVFDATRESTFEAVTKWKTDLDNKVQLNEGNRLPCVLLANKCDLAKEGFDVDLEQMDEFCKENGFAKWFETSAKANINITTSFEFLISEIMKHHNQLQEQTPGNYLHGVTINVTNKRDSKKKSVSKCDGCNSSSD